MGWFGPLGADCHCCGECLPSTGTNNLCFNETVFLHSIEIEVPSWAGNLACGNCDQQTSGTFVLQRDINSPTPLWVYNNADAAPGCQCGDVDRLRVYIDCNFAQPLLGETYCCRWIVRMRFEEIEIGQPVAVARRLINFLYRPRKTLTPGDRFTASVRIASSQQGTPCMCDFSSQPKFVKVQL